MTLIVAIGETLNAMANTKNASARMDMKRTGALVLSNAFNEIDLARRTMTVTDGTTLTAMEALDNASVMMDTMRIGALENSNANQSPESATTITIAAANGATLTAMEE